MRTSAGDLRLFFVVGLMCALHSSTGTAARIINGDPVAAGTWTNVIKLRGAAGGKVGGACTGTVIGPRVVITAAHCAKKDTSIVFMAGAKNYTAKFTTSPLYPNADHDISLGITTEDMTGITPATVVGKAKAVAGLPLMLLGFGVTDKAGTSGTDGTLRGKNTVITGFLGFDMVSKLPGGAVVAFGDSGGPAFYTDNGKPVLIGINTKGNLVDTNWTTRLDIDASQTFLTTTAASNAVQICGITGTCDGSPTPTPTPIPNPTPNPTPNPNPLPPNPIPVPDPVVVKPSCRLTSSPANVKLGDMMTLSLITENATTATVDGHAFTVPTGTWTFKTTQPGNFSPRATVTGPGGTNTCDGFYKVDTDSAPVPSSDRPTCTLTANPHDAKVGELITLEMVTLGQVTYASIDSTGVSYPEGKKIITAKIKGDLSATGFVKGPNGSSNCFADYRVIDDGTGPAPTAIPNFTIVPAYCGENTLIESKVATVCIGIVKKDSTTMDLKVTQALVVTYSDSTKEILPILSRRTHPANEGDTQVKEDLTLYANGLVNGPDYVVMATQTATLTKMAPTQGAGDVPTAIEGRTSKGKYFLVEQMKAF